MKRLVLGLTGSIGSGKSTVSKIFSDIHGFYIIDADKISRSVTEKGSPLLDELAAAFGSDIINDNGALNRKKLAEYAFSSDAGVKRLNSITHPPILKEMEKALEYTLTHGISRVILDAPLLFEASLEKLCDKVLSVIAPYSIKIERVKRRDGCTEEEVARRLSKQKSDEYYIQNSDYIINNDDEDIYSKVEMLIEKLRGGGFDV